MGAVKILIVFTAPFRLFIKKSRILHFSIRKNLEIQYILIVWNVLYALFPKAATQIP